MESVILSVLNLQNIVFIIIGLLTGSIVGCLPGLTATMALAIVVPFTFAMSPIVGLSLLGGLYVGAIYGGAISAVLINTPGTPSAIATAFDGYPLARKGMAEHGLIASGIGSATGGIIGAIALLILTPLLASIALSFGPPQYFWIAVFGLTIIGTLTSKSILKGLISGAIGVFISTIGVAPIGGEIRYSFGFYQLQGGVNLIVALIGLFAIPQVLEMVKEIKNDINAALLYKRKKGVVKEVLIYTLFKKPFLTIRSAIIGLIIGIIPGAGGNIAGIISYNEAVRFSKKPEEFGTGIIEGVLASDCATGAEVGGSLIPLLTLGIPGSPPAAVLIGALLIQGMTPGPDLLIKHADIVNSFLVSFLIANILLFFVGIFLPRYISKLINLPRYLLVVFIVFLTVIGSYSVRNNMFDVYVMVLIGIVGYVLQKFDFHPAPIVLGLILGPIAERGFVQSLLLVQSEHSILKVFVGNFISIFLIFLTIISLFWPILSKKIMSIGIRK